jgi:hypothetical protein
MSGEFCDPDSIVVKLGGPRNIISTISLKDNMYKIHLSFTPISCFDESMNSLINKEKGELYAVDSLMWYLTSGKYDDLELIVKNASVIKSHLYGGRYVTIVQIPKPSVSLIRKVISSTKDSAKRVAPNTIKITKQSSFLVADDYIKTIKSITDSNSSKAPLFTGDIPVFNHQITVVDELFQKRILSLKKQVTEDKWLLSHEKTAILEIVKEAEVFFERRILSSLKEYINAIDLMR